MKKLFSLSQAVVLCGVLLLTLCMPGCTKKRNGAGDEFTGKYAGTNCTGATAPDITISNGGGSVILMSIPVGNGACAIVAVLKGHVSGADVTFDRQLFNDLCGDEITISGTAELSSNVLSISLTGVYALSGSATGVGVPYCFTGTRINH